MNEIFVIRNVDTGAFYGGPYKQKYCKPTDCPCSDYTAWTIDINEFRHYDSLHTANSSAKRLATEFKQVIGEIQNTIKFFEDKIITPDPDSHGGPWMKKGIPSMRQHLSGHQASLKLIKSQQPKETEGVALTLQIASVRQ